MSPDEILAKEAFDAEIVRNNAYRHFDITRYETVGDLITMYDKHGRLAMYEITAARIWMAPGRI